MIKNWEHISLEEQQTRIKAVVALLKQFQLDHIKPIMIDQVVFSLKTKEPKRVRLLLILGNVSSDKAEDVEKFTKAVYEGALSGLSKKTAVVQIDTKLNVGDQFKAIEDVVDIVTQDAEKIEHEEGEVILIDFWATWCGPCQGPMAHNQHMLYENGKKWGDKVRIIGVSLDDNLDVVAKHVKKNKWNLVEHYHIGGSNSKQEYGVSGIPHVVLIDTKGTIVYVGHPAQRELEKDIETLLQGKQLQEVKSPRLGPIDYDKFKDIELPKVRKEMDQFAKEVKSLTSNQELVKYAKTMERDFLISTCRTIYDDKQDKFLSLYVNNNILVGTNKAIQLSKKAIEDFLKSFNGSFESDFKVDIVPIMGSKL